MGGRTLMRKPWRYGVAFLTFSGLLIGPAEAAPPQPTLEARAILPAYTIAPGPVSGTLLGPGPINGIDLPFPGQVVQGFSAVIEGREPGEYLAMSDNGFGGKANSRDFLLRAYWIHPHWKTAQGGSGAVAVGDFIQLRDSDRMIGFPIVNEDTADRLLTGGDLDPESLQRAHDGTLWIGDEFGPFIVHTDATGRLLEPPFAIPGVKSPNNPFLVPGEVPNHPNSRGIEGMAISKNGKSLYVSLEGALRDDPDQRRRLIFEFSTVAKQFTGQTWQYRTEDPRYMLADMVALDQHRLVVIERDAGRGLTALFRKVYLIDLREIRNDGYLRKTDVVDLARIPDPRLISLPALNDGDVGLGDPFSVACESVEGIHPIDGSRLLIACDNNIPNTGRNPHVADNNEFIVIRVPGLAGR